MLGVLFYLVGCSVATVVLTMLYMLTRPLKKRDEIKSWHVLMKAGVFTVLAPFAYVEGLTACVGKDFEAPIKEAYDQVSANGDLQYFRILTCSHGHAYAILVGADKEDWGGNDRPIVGVNLSKNEKNKWELDTFKVISSSRLNKDGIIFPPYQ